MSIFKGAYESVKAICYRSNGVFMQGGNPEYKVTTYERNGNKGITIYGSPVIVDGVMKDVLPIVMRHAMNVKKNGKS